MVHFLTIMHFKTREGKKAKNVTNEQGAANYTKEQKTRLFYGKKKQRH